MRLHIPPENPSSAQTPELPDSMDEEGYLALRWNNHNVIFTKILNLLREQEAYTDVSLACAGRFFAAHKFVLSTCSDYFKEMFLKTPCKHPVVFMKDVTGPDMQSLLDFMYKGEVHVPQSQLGSLLRTAEGLQVKGLAVPDDTTRSSSVPMGTTPLAFTAPVPSPGNVPGTGANQVNKNSSLNSNLNASFPVKRKREPENMKKEELPKLTPGLGLSGHSSVRSPFRNGAKGKSGRGSGMPELKRIKMSVEQKTMRAVRKNNVHPTTTTPTPPTPTTPTPTPTTSSTSGGDVNNEVNENSSEASLTLPKEEESVAGLIPIKCIKEEVESRPEDELEGSLEDAENGENETESQERRSLGDDEAEEEEEEEEEEEGPEENSSAILPSEGDENSSLPNSEMSTAELLQVDLSEDGTQFIIGPGGIGGEVSRASSATEEELTEGPKKPFICLLCGHTFTRRDNLANHLKTHTGDRPFMCQYCHKCFSRKDYLKQHERIHTGEKPYACQTCGRAFTRKEGLTDHMRCHSDFKAFACETCGKSFKQKCGLRFHKRNYRH